MMKTIHTVSDKESEIARYERYLAMYINSDLFYGRVDGRVSTRPSAPP